jgi:RNA polymerase sigma factor (TIGR02999 family)
LLRAGIFDTIPRMSAAASQVTGLLRDWKSGDASALERLAPLVHYELRRLAQRYLRDEHAANTLQPTALVHDLYVQLLGGEQPDWQSRGHFYGIAAHRMRQILVEHARQRNAAKRGGGAERVTLNEMIGFAPERSGDVVALDEALTQLGKQDQRKCTIIELRYFAGLSVGEIAEALAISVATVGREQRLAEAWLKRQLSSEAN